MLLALFKRENLATAMEPALVEQVLELSWDFASKSKLLSTVWAVLILLSPCLNAAPAEISFTFLTADHVLHNRDTDRAFKLCCKFSRICRDLIERQS